MKKFLSVILILLLVAVIAVVGAAAYVYFTYLAPGPSEFRFIAPTADITAIEVISVTKLDGNQLELKPISAIDNTEEFLADFSSLECMKGISVEFIDEISLLTTFEAIRVTYADGSYEVITAYGNLDSSIFDPDLTPMELIEKEYFFFDAEEFGALIDKYSAE